jgi:hypothetical protein
MEFIFTGIACSLSHGKGWHTSFRIICSIQQTSTQNTSINPLQHARMSFSCDITFTYTVETFIAQSVQREEAREMGPRLFSLTRIVLPSNSSSVQCRFYVKPYRYNRPDWDVNRDTAFIKIAVLFSQVKLGPTYRECTYCHRCLDSIWAIRTLESSRLGCHFVHQEG